MKLSSKRRSLELLKVSQLTQVADLAVPISETSRYSTRYLIDYYRLERSAYRKGFKNRGH